MSSPGTNSDGAAGQMRPSDVSSLYNSIIFQIEQQMGLAWTVTVVKVTKVTNQGDVSPNGTVDCQVMVKMLDGAGNATSHITAMKFPYLRLQGGKNAIIMDPQVGDLGIAVFANRDISSVKKTKKEANPGSYRQFDLADGMYLGGILNDTPEQYVQFNDQGITIKDKNDNKIEMTSDGINFVSDKLTHNGTDIGDDHMHSGVQTGSGDTGPPV